MSNNDWTSKLREQMADYQEPVKDDLWMKISQSLHAQSVQKARIVKLRRWSAAAAAVALLGVGGSYVYLHQDAEVGGVPAKSAPVMAQGSPISEKSSVSSAAPAPASSILAVASGLKSSVVSALSSLGTSSASSSGAVSGAVSDQAMLALAEEPTVASASELVSVDEAPVCTTEQSATTVQPAAPVRKAQEMRTANVYDAEFVNKAAKSADWNVKLYAENGLMMGNSSPGSSPVVMGTYEDASGNLNYTSFASAPYLSQLKIVNKPKAKHHAPISVGAQVGVHLAERLTLSTGVVYTRTSSDFATSEVVGYDTKQVLHYVGVPLGINYEVWGTKNLHTYVMLGGEADFNVKNHTEVEGVTLDQDEVKKDRAQFSGKASVGVQYDVVPQVGFYVEPGAKYYFDNGSDIENTFKDKKWNFNLQFGLRINIK